MIGSEEPKRVLVADDDPDDRMLIDEAFEENRLANDLYFVEDGQDLLDYLKRDGKWSDAASSPRPGLILLDLNMPRMNGEEFLEAMKGDRRFSAIDVVIVTTESNAGRLMRLSKPGIAGFLHKPFMPEDLREIAGQALGKAS